jgi:hypothetical protein
MKSAQFAASVRYADTGPDMDSIMDNLNRAAHKLDVNSLHFVLHSMAGTMAPDIVERLDKKRRMGMFAYNCSPWTEEYVVEQNVVDVINLLPLRGTYLTKFGLQAYDRFFREQVEDLSLTEKIGVVWKQVNDQSSPQTWVSQIAYLARRQKADYGNIPESSKSVLIVPQDLSTDKVVLLPQVIEDAKNIIPGELSVMKARSEGHANPNQYRKEYNEVMRVAAEENALVFSSEWAVVRRHAGQIRSFDT